MDLTKSLQDQFAPKTICFGCGPVNKDGLQIKSFVQGDKVVASFNPLPHHQSFPGMMNGGIIGALLDCHSNWTAAWHLMNENGLSTPPCCVTAKYEVTFEKPTRSGIELTLCAWVVESSKRKAVIDATLSAAGEITARCRGTFVSVKPDHPAFSGPSGQPG